MNHELFETLESRIGELLGKYTVLKNDNVRLAEENQRLLAEREALKSRIDAIDNFPVEAETPVLEEILIKAPVMSVTLTADTDETGLRKIAEMVRDDLLTYQAPKPAGLGEWIARAVRGPPRISQVEIAGTRPYEISIEVSEEKLRQLGLKLADVAQAVRTSTLDLPGGSIRTERGEVILHGLAPADLHDGAVLPEEELAASELGVVIETHRFPVGARVAAELEGAGAPVSISAAPNAVIELPTLSAAHCEPLHEVEVVNPGSPVANPGFDVTPARLVTGIITERGVAAASTEGLLSLYPERRAAG